MSYRSAIRKAINENTRYIVHKIYPPQHDENFAGSEWLTIEIEVHKKKRIKKKLK